MFHTYFIKQTTYIAIFIIIFSDFSVTAQVLTTRNKLTDKSLKSPGNMVKQWKESVEKWGIDSSYRNSISLGARFNSNGWSGTLLFGRKISNSKATILSAVLSEIRDEKQAKIQSKVESSRNPGTKASYVFGKINYVYSFDVGIGQELLLIPHLIDDNISISLKYSTGISMAIIKPYFLSLMYSDGSGKISVLNESYGVNNQDKFLDKDSIAGAYKWNAGFNQIKTIPGVYGEICFILEPIKHKALIQKTLFGIHCSVYKTGLPIMAERRAIPYTMNFFLGIEFGKRW